MFEGGKRGIFNRGCVMVSSYLGGREWKKKGGFISERNSVTSPSPKGEGF